MLDLKSPTVRTPEELLKWPTDLLVLTGADDDESDDSNDDDANDDADEDADADKGGDKDDSDKDDSDDKDSDKDDDKVDRKDYDRLVARKKEAEKRLTAAHAEIAKLKKDGISDETVKNELKDTQGENEKLRTQISKLSLTNAFLSDNTHSWVDPEAALKLADLTDVEIDEDGATQGLKPALDKLAKDKPWLLKAKESDKRPSRRTGDKPGSSTGKDKDKQSTDAKKREQAKRYPALRGR